MQPAQVDLAERVLKPNILLRLQAWQAAAAVQYSGADLERGIAFLLEGALDDQAAAYRFLEAAGDQLPDIDVSGPLQQACHPLTPSLRCMPGSPGQRLTSLPALKIA